MIHGSRKRHSVAEFSLLESSALGFSLKHSLYYLQSHIAHLQSLGFS